LLLLLMAGLGVPVWRKVQADRAELDLWTRGDDPVDDVGPRPPANAVSRGRADDGRFPVSSATPVTLVWLCLLGVTGESPRMTADP